MKDATAVVEHARHRWILKSLCSITLLSACVSLSAQNVLFQTGFETGDPAPIYSLTTGNYLTTASTQPYTGLSHAELVGGCTGSTSGCYSASIITPTALNLVAGKYYEVVVYGKDMPSTCDVNNSLKIKKSATATDAAMVAATGSDIILGTSNQLFVYDIYRGIFTVSSNETKYIGIQMSFPGAGGCAGSGWRIDDITITEYDGPPCSYYCYTEGIYPDAGYISQVSLNTLNRPSGFDGYACTGMSTFIQRTLSYNLSVTRFDPSTYNLYTSAWIDYNRNGLFTDAGEQVMVPAASAANGNQTRIQNITVPLSATLGVTKMRVMMKYNVAPTGPCDGSSPYFDIEDYDIDIQQEPVPMTFVSCTTTQTNTTSVNAGDYRQQVVGVQIVTNGELSPLSVTSFNFATTGTTNPSNNISVAQLWSTGTSNAFATTTQVGSTVPAPNGNFSIATAHTLAKGTNYFWLTYDVPATATGGNVIDAQCSSLMVTTLRTPTVTNPPGCRTIIATTPMVYVSSTTKQNISPVAIADVNQQIIGVEIVANGALSPLSATSFTFNTAGTGGTVTNQIQNAKLFFTGTNSIFSTSNQVGSAVAIPNGAFTITPSAAQGTLFNGTNYFWLSYDIKSTATCVLIVDAQCNSVTVGGTPHVPTITSPLGGRQINCGVPYYSQGNLVMNNLSSWNSQRNGSGTTPTLFSAVNDFYVQNGHSMTTSADFTIANLYVESGGYVTATNLLTMSNLRLYPYAIFEQVAVAPNPNFIGNFWIDDNGTWIHNNTGWLPGQNRYFTANSIQWFKQVGGGTFPVNTAWGNVIMDVNTNSNFVINAGSIVTVQGNWEWRKTGFNNWLGISPDNSPVNVAGNLIFSGGKLRGAYDMSAPGNQAANITINVAGNLVISGGAFEDYVRGNSATSGSTLNINGNVEITGGTWNYVRATSGLSQINMMNGILSATWKQTGGNVTLSNTNIKNSPAGKTVTLIGNKLGNISAGRIFTIETGAKLMTSNYPVTGTGTFTMQDNSTLGIGSIDGINSNLASATGNVQTSGGRNYHSGGNYIYYEDKTPQITGVFTTAPTALTVRNLEIKKDGAAQITNMSQNLSVSEITKLTLGELNLNQFILTALSNSTGAIDRNGTTTLGYIKSETNLSVNPSIVQWNTGTANGSYVIPFGVSSTEIIPLTFQKTAGNSNIRFSTRATSNTANTPWAGISSVAAVANMNRYGSDSSVTSVIDRWWDITAMSGYNAVTANIIFSYRAAENTLPVNPPYRTGPIAAQHWNGSAWDPPVCSVCNNGVTSGIGSVTVSGANTFSPWILVAQPAPLPVELISFNAEVVPQGVELRWSTASEINNDYFTIERSTDAIHFENLLQKDGAGNSSQVLHYSALDKNPFQGISYYRLRQTDFDGTSSWSDAVSVFIGGSDNVTIFPNPASDVVRIIFFGNMPEAYNSIELTDVLGKSVMSESILLSENDRTKILNTANLDKGIYLIHITNGSGTSIAQKIIIN
jgi:hypothetical protein